MSACSLLSRLRERWLVFLWFLAGALAAAFARMISTVLLRGDTARVFSANDFLESEPLDSMLQSLLNWQARLVEALSWAALPLAPFPLPRGKITALALIVLVGLWSFRVWVRYRVNRDGLEQSLWWFRRSVDVVSLYALLLLVSVCLLRWHYPAWVPRGYWGLTLPMALYWDAVSAVCGALITGALLTPLSNLRQALRYATLQRYPALCGYYLVLMLFLRIVDMAPVLLARTSWISIDWVTSIDTMMRIGAHSIGVLLLGIPAMIAVSRMTLPHSILNWVQNLVYASIATAIFFFTIMGYTVLSRIAFIVLTFNLDKRTLAGGFIHDAFTLVFKAGIVIFAYERYICTIDRYKEEGVPNAKARV